MLIITSIFSSVLAGMGIGGGAIFILLSTTFFKLEQKEAQFLNLILFLAVSLGATITNIKNKEIDFNLAKKILPFLLLGSIIGTYFFNRINEQRLNKYFIYFLLLIGIYEIISSVINMKKVKNNTK
ncbi:MAG: sulfite exporter TauE/SafE family protein [Clostridia bacterium]|nr:sulfite exporter TauE/SafE family protein [Clostridia bacterium]